MQKEILEHDTISNGSRVKLKLLGNSHEVLYTSRKNTTLNMKRLEGREYEVVNRETGEIETREFRDPSKNRVENLVSLRKSFNKISELLKCNITDASKARFITLTYAENMTDNKKLSRDFDVFYKRFKRYNDTHFADCGKLQYLYVAEPQARGAWHCHVVLWWEHKAPFIVSDKLAKLWGHGFVHVRAVTGTGASVAKYLTAYLANVELSKASSLEIIEKAVADGRVIEKVIDGQKKSFIKGGRLQMYPSGMNLYRHSRGLKQPTIIKDISYVAAKEIIGDKQPNYKKAIKLIDDDTGLQINIIKEYYD